MFGAEVEVADDAREVVAASDLLHLLGDLGAVGMDAVIRVGHDELEPVLGAGGDQEIEEGEGIGAPRDRDQRAPRREAETGQDGGQVGGEIHAVNWRVGGWAGRRVVRLADLPSCRLG